MIKLLKPAWAYRGFILASVQREFQSKYRNSLLGAAWTLIQPLSMVAIYTLVFSQLMRARVPGVDSQLAYSIHLCAGIFTWEFFGKVIGRGQTIFIEHANLIKKLSFPKICLAIIAVLNSGLDFAIIFGLFAGFLVLSGNFPGWVFVALLPVLIIQVAFAIGLGIIFGVLNVFFRDVGLLVGIVLQFWFWFTPIVYPANILPEWAQGLLVLNPMTAVITSYQRVLVRSEWPIWADLAPVALFALLVCVFGMRLFAKRSAEMVDEL
jgi:lipopolysaccharide transport system permease protein